VGSCCVVWGEGAEVWCGIVCVLACAHACVCVGVLEGIRHVCSMYVSMHVCMCAYVLTCIRVHVCTLAHILFVLLSISALQQRLPFCRCLLACTTMAKHKPKSKRDVLKGVLKSAGPGFKSSVQKYANRGVPFVLIQLLVLCLANNGLRGAFSAATGKCKYVDMVEYFAGVAVVTKALRSLIVLPMFSACFLLHV
jgi:hypothetical protein